MAATCLQAPQVAAAAAGGRQRQQARGCTAAAARCRLCNPLRAVLLARQGGSAAAPRRGEQLCAAVAYLWAAFSVASAAHLAESVLVESACSAISAAGSGMRVLALDAAFPFDREARMRKEHSQQLRCVPVAPGLGSTGRVGVRQPG